jgi:hypothetical protein
MYAKRLIEIGTKVGPLRYAVKMRLNAAEETEQDISAYKVRMTPSEGWQGKNEAERKTAQDKAYLDNLELQGMVASLRGIKREIATLEAEIDQYSDERRGLEYAVMELQYTGIDEVNAVANGAAMADSANKHVEEANMQPVQAAAAPAKPDLTKNIVRLPEDKPVQPALPVAADAGLTPGPSLAVNVGNPSQMSGAVQNTKDVVVQSVKAVVPAAPTEPYKAPPGPAAGAPKDQEEAWLKELGF